MEFLVQPMSRLGVSSPDCVYDPCPYHDGCPVDWCDNYCGDFDPCPGYSCGGYSTRSIGE